MKRIRVVVVSCRDEFGSDCNDHYRHEYRRYLLGTESLARCTRSVFADQKGKGSCEPLILAVVLPQQLDTEHHLAIAARKLSVVQEQVRGHVRIGSAQGVVHRTDQSAGLKNGGLSQRKVAMVKRIEGVDTKL